MASPKHLWSGDWERDSEAVHDAREFVPSTPAPEPPAPEPEPPRPAARRPGRRIVLLTALAALIVVGAVWAITSSGGSHKTDAAANVTNYSQSGLGLVLQSVPVNRVVVAAVVPGSPAAQANLGAGDLLLTVNGQAAQSPGQVNQILSHIPRGHQVTLQLDQGPVAIQAQITLSGTAATP